MRDATWYGTVALVAAVLVVVVGGFAIAAEAPASAGTANAAVTVSYLNLTVRVNPTNGFPAYSPANFSVPKGEVRVKIVDTDATASFPGCDCNVTGTQGNVESVNGSAPTSQIGWGNVAHTFSIPTLGVNVLSPGESTVTFTLWLNQTGAFVWLCDAPCGTNGFEGAPMGVPGYMTGTMTVL